MALSKPTFRKKLLSTPAAEVFFMASPFPLHFLQLKFLSSNEFSHESDAGAADSAQMFCFRFVRSHFFQHASSRARFPIASVFVADSQRAQLHEYTPRFGTLVFPGQRGLQYFIIVILPLNARDVPGNSRVARTFVYIVTGFEPAPSWHVVGQP